MGDRLEMNLLSKSVHDLGKFYRVAIIFGQVSFRKRRKCNWCWIEVIRENLDEKRGIREFRINPEDNSTNLIYQFADTISFPCSLFA
jgi:hypothetical protein